MIAFVSLTPFSNIKDNGVLISKMQQGKGSQDVQRGQFCNCDTTSVRGITR